MCVSVILCLYIGISGALNVTENMEALAASLMLNKVDGVWAKVAFPSKKPLGAWFADVLLRVEQYLYIAGNRAVGTGYQVEWTCGAEGVNPDLLPDNCKG